MLIRTVILAVLVLVVPSMSLQTRLAEPPQSTRATPSAKTPSGKKTTAAPKKKAKKPVPPRVRRVRRAFVASADLKPMALQLLEHRSPQAYSAIEKYARAHPRSDAGALAWLTIGYARFLDREYPQAIEALKKARPNAGELGDYVDYHLALSQAATGAPTEAAGLLRDFEKTYRDSLFLREARVAYANALTVSGQPAQAIAVLQPHRSPVRAEVELAIGLAFAATGDTAQAATVLRKLYYAMPLSAEAGEAKAALDTLPSLPPASLAEQKQRAELLLQGRRFAVAAEEYRGLLKIAPAEERAPARVALGYALFKSGREKDARRLLEAVTDAPPEAHAQRLYALLEMERPDDDEVRKHLDSLRQSAPDSPWFMEGLLSAANMYLLEREDEKAARLYAEIDERFPGSKYASYAHWRAAWLTYRLGRKGEAKYLFEQQIALYPGSAETPNALYWRGRLAEAENDLPRARAYYQKLVDRFRNYFYSDRARARLAAMQPGGAAADSILERIEPVAFTPSPTPVQPPSDHLRAQKALLLENGGLIDLAVRELQASQSPPPTWALAEMARLYRESDRHYRALQTLKHALPSYYALELGALPRPLWEALFPLPYWDDIQRFSSANGLDPFLVASLIRQESEFNPGAVSRANAVGLMQLLPPVGRKVAKQVKLRGYSTSLLTVPKVNIQLGTHYLRQVLDDHEGQLEYALAAYNAGNHRVEKWLDGSAHADIDEFVESIPFTETREYVQAILRNATLYRRLYARP